MRASIALLCLALTACSAPGDEGARTDVEALRAELLAELERTDVEVGLFYRSLGDRPDSVAIGADTRMHAASTMKVPVLMRFFLDEQEGIRSLDGTLPITRTFHSIVDGSPFELPPESDSDTTWYGSVGEEVAVRDLMDRMITWSSNLATNILIATADAERVTAMLREMGVDSMEVLRGVEDIPAFRAGLSNTTTARDLGTVMRLVAEGDRFTAESRAEMLAILERQHYREHIPAGLPEGTRVANKTGWITGIRHDAAIVFPPEAPPYVLVVMQRGDIPDDDGVGLSSRLSRIVWEYHAGAVAAREPSP